MFGSTAPLPCVPQWLMPVQCAEQPDASLLVQSRRQAGTSFGLAARLAEEPGRMSDISPGYLYRRKSIPKSDFFHLDVGDDSRKPGISAARLMRPRGVNASECFDTEGFALLRTSKWHFRIFNSNFSRESFFMGSSGVCPDAEPAVVVAEPPPSSAATASGSFAPSFQ
jgi:hypothetical protein